MTGGRQADYSGRWRLQQEMTVRQWSWYDRIRPHSASWQHVEMLE